MNPKKLIGNLVGRRWRDEELDAEVRSFAEMLTDEKLREGMKPEDAQRAARIELGGIEQVKEQVRDVRAFSWFYSLVQDVRFGLRMLRKSPGFTAIAVLTLALGIGANTVIFSVVNAVLLRPLPFSQSDQLVSVAFFDTIRKAPDEYLSIPNFCDWRSQNRVFRGMTAFYEDTYTLTGADEATHLNAAVVSADFFSTLGIAPQLGRGFLPTEEEKGRQVVVLSDHLWRTMFNADPKIIGRGITLNDQSHIVVGVAPPGFDFPITTPPVQIWTTLSHVSEWINERDARFLTVVGRMKPDVTVPQVQAEISRINAVLAKEYPNSNLRYGDAVVVPELQHLVGDARPALLILFGAVGFVLFIACANVASLLLARSMTREKEMAIRTALGGGRSRVIRQLLTESVLLALIGGFFGFLLALWGTDGLLRLVPEDIPRMSEIQMDGRVFLFTLLAAIVTGILFGLAPALQCARRGPFDVLKRSGGGAGASGGILHNRVRSILVVTEMALSLALLMGAGLMMRSFARLQSVNPGFDPHNKLTFFFNLPQTRYGPDQRKAFYSRLLDRLNTLPGVVSAAGAVTLPFGGGDMNMRLAFEIEGRPTLKGSAPEEEFGDVGPGYFNTMGIPLLEGREFDSTDTPTSPDVIIINQAFAKHYFPNQDPVGRRMNPILKLSSNSPMREIVGVVGNVKTSALNSDPEPEFFVPYQQVFAGELTMVLRTYGAPESVLGAARDAVHSMDASLPIYAVESMEQYVGASVAQPRFSMMLLMIFAGLALALTTVGIYGVMTYAVTQRTHEIGIRMAMGARRGDVMGLVLRYGIKLALAGIVAGVAAALALTRLLETALYNVSAQDPLTFASVAIALVLITLAACYIPARRAVRTDPMVALHHE
jgi:predicted permease